VRACGSTCALTTKRTPRHPIALPRCPLAPVVVRVRVRVHVRVRASWHAEGHGSEFAGCAEVRDLVIIPMLAVSFVWTCGMLYLLFKWRSSPLNAMWPCRALLVVVAFCWQVRTCARAFTRARVAYGMGVACVGVYTAGGERQDRLSCVRVSGGKSKALQGLPV